MRDRELSAQGLENLLMPHIQQGEIVVVELNPAETPPSRIWVQSRSLRDSPETVNGCVLVPKSALTTR
jgi:hypothetical protein